MKITLIYPGITECGFNSLKGSEGSWLHHGLSIISTCLKQSGYEVHLIDLRRLKSWNHFYQLVVDSECDIFGITMMSVDFNPGTKAARIIKDIKPECKVIVGGAHPSLCPEEFEKLEYIDYIVKGEGEISFPRIINSIKKGQQIPRIIQGEPIKNLDDAPWADRDLFKGLEEPILPFFESPFVTLITGRGCKYNCKFCQPSERIIFGKNVRRRSVNSVIKELKYLKNKYSFKSFMIHDDCLTEDRNWVMSFCEMLKKNGFHQPFVCQSRADIICRNPDMIEALKNAGLKLIIIGFESGSDRVLRFLRKGCNREQNIKAAQICRDLDIKIWANYMIGLPTETKDEVMATYSLLKEIKPYHCSPAFYTPHPGSELFELGKKMGIHLISSHNSYRRNTYDAKIKGPDYNFLRKILYRSIVIGQDMNTPAPVKSREGFFGWLLSFWERWRNVIRGKVMSFSPSLYQKLILFKRINNE